MNRIIRKITSYTCIEVIFLNCNCCAPDAKKVGFKFVLLFALCFLALGFFSAALTGGPEAYGEITNPPFSPPPALFGIAWSVLYLLTGGVFGTVYGTFSCANSRDRENGLFFFALGFVFNLLWYPLFFGKGQYAGSLIDIAIIFILTFLAARCFYRIRPLYAYLTVPYLIWLVYAFYLNSGVILLN